MNNKGAISGIHEFYISGLNCIDCATKIEGAVSRLKGIRAAKVNFSTSLLKIVFEKNIVNESFIEETVEREIARMGFSIEKGDVATVVFRARGAASDREIAGIKMAIVSLNGVRRLDILGSHLFKIEYNTGIIQTHRIKRVLDGFGMEVVSYDNGKETKRPMIRGRLNLTLVIASGLLICLGIGVSFLEGSLTGRGSAFEPLHPGIELTSRFRYISTSLYLLAIIAGGYHIARRGLLSIKDLHLDINSLMCIAVIGAACIGEWLEGATVIFLFSLAQLLETYTLDKSRNAIRSLMELSPKEALVRLPTGETYVQVDDVKVGDIIVVKPGERISLDGRVVSGCSAVNQSPITGESIPVEKVKGNDVYAGTINGNGSMDVEVTHLSRDSTMARIIHLIEDAQAQKAPFQSFVDRFARYYTPAVILLAVFVALAPPLISQASFVSWFYRALVLLVISCPCALVISTPVSLISGITCAARNGILFKGGTYLEQLGNLSVMAFDKTGTLTGGGPEVTDIIPVNLHDRAELLQLAASIETRSEHGLARPILKKAEEEGLDILDGRGFQAFTGKGAMMEIHGTKCYIGSEGFFEGLGFSVSDVEGILRALQDDGKTALIVGRDGVISGIIAVADTIKKGCRQTIRELYNEGLKRIVVLTGDHERTARAVCKGLDIDECISELSPEGKANAIKTLIKEYGKTGMVGDGINDAPALTTATVGVAMGAGGIDITIESADVTLIGDDLSKLPLAIRLSKQTLRVIKQNIFISIFIKGIFLLLAVPGLATLWMAVGADMGASLLVIINGLRLLRTRNAVAVRQKFPPDGD